MKIGIITFHCAYNFGSVLQAWALKHQVENMGHTVQVLDYRGHDFDQYRLIQTYSAKAFAASLALYPRQRRRRDAFEAFISQELCPTKRYGANDEERMAQELSDEFDCFICGSDQIWNVDCTRGPVGPYFLSFAGEARRVAYAPSLSHTSFSREYFGPHEQEQIQEWLSRFSAISIREAATTSLFQPFCTQSIDVCVDPTLLLDASDYEQITHSPRKDTRLSSPDKTLFVYMLERNDALVAYASDLAKQSGMHIAYVSRRPLRFDGVPATNLFGAGPGEFLWYVKNCAAVLTNSFHATVFSMLFGTPFQTFTTSRSGSRMRELLHNFKLEDHLIDMDLQSSGYSDLPQAVPMDKVGSMLVQERAHSLSFLEQALAE